MVDDDGRFHLHIGEEVLSDFWMHLDRGRRDFPCLRERHECMVTLQNLL